MPRNAADKKHKGPGQEEVQTTAQRNKRGHKQMEKYSKFMFRKNQYSENGHIAHSNLEMQHYLHQATNDLLHVTGKTT